jgi:hypothetical protein
MYRERTATIELGIKGERVALSDHVAYFWESEKQFKEAVGFLELGLKGRDACIVFGHPAANANVVAALAERGFDAEELQAQNRLRVLVGKSSGKDMLSSLGIEFQGAIDRGSPLIRLLGNIGWGHPDWPTELDILEFEARVTEACLAFPCVVVCMYDVAHLSGRIMVHGAYETHPLTMCGNVLRENPHCQSIDAFLENLDKTA